MFQSHELAVVITPPLGVFIQIVCVFGSQLLALSNALHCLEGLLTVDQALVCVLNSAC